MVNAEHKLLSHKLSRCSICDKSNADYTNLMAISAKEKLSIDQLVNHLGRRSLDKKYSYKYSEDAELRVDSQYIDPLTGMSELWTICNCEKVVHPDCFLRSLTINFNYKCYECGEIFRLGYKKIKISTGFCFWIWFIVELIVSIAFFVAFIVFMSKSVVDTSILVYRCFGLFFLCFSFSFMARLFLNIIEKPTTFTKEIYLLPFPYKHGLNFGVERYEMITCLKTAGSNHDLIINTTNEGHLPTESEKEGMLKEGGHLRFCNLFPIKCAFIQEMLKDVNSLGNAPYQKKEKFLQKNYEYHYNISNYLVISRFITFVKAKFNLVSVGDIISLKVERENFFRYQIVRNSLEKKEFEDIQEFAYHRRLKDKEHSNPGERRQKLARFKSNASKFSSKELFNVQHISEEKLDESHSVSESNNNRHKHSDNFNESNKSKDLKRRELNKQFTVIQNSKNGVLESLTNQSVSKKFQKQQTKNVKSLKVRPSVLINNMTNMAASINSSKVDDQIKAAIMMHKKTEKIKKKKEDKDRQFIEDYQATEFHNVIVERKKEKSMPKSELSHSSEGSGYSSSRERKNSEFFTKMIAPRKGTGSEIANPDQLSIAIESAEDIQQPSSEDNISHESPYRKLPGKDKQNCFKIIEICEEENSSVQDKIQSLRVRESKQQLESPSKNDTLTYDFHEQLFFKNYESACLPTKSSMGSSSLVIGSLNLED